MFILCCLKLALDQRSETCSTFYCSLEVSHTHSDTCGRFEKVSRTVSMSSMFRNISLSGSLVNRRKTRHLMSCCWKLQTKCWQQLRLCRSPWQYLKQALRDIQPNLKQCQNKSNRWPKRIHFIWMLNEPWCFQLNTSESARKNEIKAEIQSLKGLFLSRYSS